ncbi:hypothetical protein [Streptomyces sp. LNU-CPARS28]|uniref:hypothetical protein n=1 Tax=Streptomyces sp. LNU-CPARS28 TaxID=3137371 RepID=UPI0031365C27
MTAPLTRRQILVIAGLARGHTTPRIAIHLNIPTEAVRSRICRAATRTGIYRSRHAGLVHHAYTHGYLTNLTPEARAPITVLTPRLAGALDALTRGLPLADSGAEMGVSPDVAREYRRQLYALLGARTRAHAVALGWQAGLLGPAAGEGRTAA